MKFLPAKFPKRWLVFFAVWILVFAIAPLRYIAQSQLQNGLWPLSKIFHQQNLSARYSDLAPRFPRDAGVWAAAAEERVSPVQEYLDDDGEPVTVERTTPPLSPLFPGKTLADEHAETRRRLDIVIEKFPQESWLIAKRLRLSWGYMHGDRIGGELSDPNLPANQAAGKPSPERQSDIQKTSPAGTEYPNYSNYTPQELQRVIALCKRGQKLEPNNAFYDWTFAYFLALSWRDAEAWNALDSAARKTGWNDHYLEETQAQLSARALLLGRPLLWEEKFWMMWSALFPEYARYREFARIVSWNSIKAQRKKNHAQALRLAGGLAKVAAKMRDNSHYIIEGLVAVAMESIAVSSSTYDARQAGKVRPSRTTMGYARSFGSYATNHGRKDLADWVARDAVRAASFRGSVAGSINGILGISFFQAALIGALWQVGVLLLLMLPFALYGYLLLSGIFRIPRARKMLLMDNPEPKISAREIWNGALACGGVRAILAALGAALVIGLTWISFLIGIGQSAQVWSAFASWWSGTISSATSTTTSGSLWEALAYEVLGMNSRPFYTEGRSGIVIALIPVLLGLLWCASRARIWQQAQERQNSDVPRAGVLALLKAILSGKIFAHTMEYDLAGAGVVLARGFFFGAFCVAWIITALPAQDSTDVVYVPMILAPLFFALLIGEAVSRWRRSTHRRSAARFGLRLLRESWLGWLALGSVLFLLTLLLALPLRNRADAAQGRILKVGEVAAQQNK